MRDSSWGSVRSVRHLADDLILSDTTTFFGNVNAAGGNDIVFAGGRPVVQAQIRHLLAVSDRPNITIQMMPLHPGAFTVDGGGFSILRFAEDDMPDVVYIEHLTGAQYLDKPEHVDRYLQVMNRLTVEALTPAATADAVAKLLVQL